MLKRPFFSIVIPTYNRVSDLQFALFCILRQSFSDYEIVISDNCSTDNTRTIVKKLKDRRIRYSKTARAIGNAMNIKRALEAAKGEYIFVHSDDDFLPYPNSLEIICEKIQKYNPGYIRVNYVSLSQDKKRIFFYRIIKPFTQDEFSPSSLENGRILSFILKSDPYFISGMIFKNAIPDYIKMVDSDPLPSINILFYLIKNYGAYIVSKPHIIALWSRRQIKKDVEHHIYTLQNGKLRSENYFNAVKEKINEQEYSIFLHRELMHLFIILFPVIKIIVGNRRMLQIAGRICLLDPTMSKSIIYWAYLILSLILPQNFLKILRDLSISLYARFSKVDNNNEIISVLNDLELIYLRSDKNVLKIKGPIFNF